jgi:membrane protease YdiL (CAAX protease family)
MSDATTSPVKDGVTDTPKTPRNKAEIERVFGDHSPASAPASAREEWSRYLGFVRRPHLPALERQASGARAVLRMLSLDLMVMLVLIAGISLAAGLGFELPENINNTLEPGLAAIALVVIAAPLGEELVFRSWLRGNPVIIGVLAVLLVGLGALPALGYAMGDGLTRQILLIGGPALALVAAPLVAYLLLNRETPPFFRRAFAFFFWLSTLGFALIHLGNYTEGSLAILLPLVLPQFALGSMLGYLRVHYGLLHAIALHAAHNAILFGLAIAGGLSEPPAAPV